MTGCSDTIVLTGFGPFPGMPENASARLVPKLVQLVERRFTAHRVVGRILPTEWVRAPADLEALYARERPKLALHFGVSERANGFVIETQGKKALRALPDASGAYPPLDSQTSAPTALAVQLPTREIVERLQALGIAARLSDDAGAYLCNAVLYRSLELALAAKEPVKVGFVHIPHVIAPAGSGGMASLDFSQALAGGLEVIRAALGRPASRRAPVRSVKGP